jgi:hypothetical protein
MKKIYQIIFFYILTVTLSNTPSNAQGWHLIKVLTDSIPVPKQIVDLCKTKEGREAILASMDTFSLKDIRLQWIAIKENDTNFKTTLKEYFLNQVDKMCTPTPGGQTGYIFDPNKMTFDFSSPVWCESRNTGGSHKYDCNEKIPITLPPGWQVCKVLYEKTHRRHGRHKFIPKFIPNDDQNPPRYNGYTLHLTGHGDVGNPSKIKISNIKILAIRDNLDNSFRKSCDCEMPSIEANKPTPPIIKPSTPSSPTSPPNISCDIIRRRENAADFVIVNSGGSRGRLSYRIDVLDGDDDTWERYEEGYIDLNPNSDATLGLHKWRAKNWKIIYKIVTRI